MGSEVFINRSQTTKLLNPMATFVPSSVRVWVYLYFVFIVDFMVFSSFQHHYNQLQPLLNNQQQCSRPCSHFLLKFFSVYRRLFNIHTYLFTYQLSELVSTHYSLLIHILISFNNFFDWMINEWIQIMSVIS